MSRFAATSAWYPRRGEVYLVRLDKDRPALILSVDELNRHARDVSIVPFTTVQRRAFSMRVAVAAGDGGLQRNCWAKCDQVTTLEKSFLRPPALGILSRSAFQEIQEQVKIALGLL